MRSRRGSSSLGSSAPAGRRIVLGVCGGIAAYKSIEVARRLTGMGCDVHVVMTRAATSFVGPITFSTLTQNPVGVELFPEPPPARIEHTWLARGADLILVAPATANMIARYALGLADDLLSSLLLAARVPVLMAPAMHTEMWENPATAANVAALKSRGVRFIGPEAGALAGPDVGMGRMSGPEIIIQAVEEQLRPLLDLTGRRVLVTAGGTREPIDPVRFIGNRSSGLMGHEVARQALSRGAETALVSGPSHLAGPPGAQVVHVSTAAEMAQAVRGLSAEADLIVMAAAVADWRPVQVSRRKAKKEAGPPRIELEPTEDILAGLLERRRPGQVIVGFAAETEELEAKAKSKLAAKPVDLLVANLVGEGAGFDVDRVRALLLVRGAKPQQLGLISKTDLAGMILDAASKLLGAGAGSGSG